MACYKSYGKDCGAVTFQTDTTLSPEDQTSTIYKVTLVQTIAQSTSKHCEKNQHYGVRVELTRVKGVQAKVIFLHWSCLEPQKTFKIDDVTGKKEHIHLYEQRVGYGKHVTREITLLQLQDAVSNVKERDCLSAAEAMYDAAVGEVESVATHPPEADITPV